MNVDAKVVTINGVDYVPVGTEVKTISGEHVIVRTYSAGVFFGIIEKREGKEVKMSVSRRLWYWDGAASLSQLAMSGTSNPSKCQFPEETYGTILTEVIEIIPCTEQAVKSINGVAIWKK